MQKLTAADIPLIFLEIRNIIVAQKELLTQLDSAMGDGDLGITMTKAFSAAGEEAGISDEKMPGKLFMKLGMVIAKTAPSTMGTLVATGFMKGGKSIETVTEIKLEQLSLFFEAFVKSIMERGKTVPGNKTIVDSLHPAAAALTAALHENQQLSDAMQAALDAARKGLLDSTQMKAQHGRAAYYQEKSIGQQDGGATVGVFIVEGFYNHIRETGK